MDSYKEPKANRRKKSDKGKEKYERNGSITQKHIRIIEALTEKRRSILAVK
jgi:hypothetical protein